MLNEIARLYRDQDCVFNNGVVNSSEAITGAMASSETYMIAANLNYDMPPILSPPRGSLPPQQLLAHQSPPTNDNNNPPFVVLNKQTNDIYFNKENLVAADDRLVYVNHLSMSFRDDVLSKDVSSLSTLDDNQLESLEDSSLKVVC